MISQYRHRQGIEHITAFRVNHDCLGTSPHKFQTLLSASRFIKRRRCVQLQLRGHSMLHQAVITTVYRHKDVPIIHIYQDLSHRLISIVTGHDNLHHVTVPRIEIKRISTEPSRVHRFLVHNGVRHFIVLEHAPRE